MSNTTIGLVIKHLQGKHDQQTHGRPDPVSFGDINKPSELTRIFALPRFPTDQQILKNIDTVRIGIVERTGVPEDVVDKIMSHWALDVDLPLSQAMKFAVSEEFGIPRSNTLGAVPKESVVLPIAAEDAFGSAPEEDDIRKLHDYTHLIVKDIYQQTQKFLAEKGIKEVVVHRGLATRTKRSKNFLHQIQQGGTSATVIGDALSSWSCELGTALVFGNAGILLTTKVPASEVFSIPKTGIGSLREAEFVLLGPKQRCEAVVPRLESKKNKAIKTKFVVGDDKLPVYQIANIPEGMKEKVKHGTLRIRGEYSAVINAKLVDTPEDYVSITVDGELAAGVWAKDRNYFPSSAGDLVASGWGHPWERYADVGA